jgi:hypothetical protein
MLLGNVYRKPYFREKRFICPASDNILVICRERTSYVEM